MTDATQPEKLDLRSLDVASGQQEKLRQLFPEVFTEGGKVDFDRLKSTLGEIVDSGKERYGLNWPGKAECFRTIQTPSRATLRPCREQSLSFDSTENLIIEGDNLEVLKLLQKGYLGQVKMIYIDPPYNTGSDFIYPDNFSESLETYLAYTGQVDVEGKRFSSNPETNGRFHSCWLNMMYPRLFLARNLLADGGFIFVSIDEHENDNLKKLCNEIFGEENLVAFVANVNNPKGRSDDKYVATAHEYLAIYKKGEAAMGGWEPEENVTRRYNKQDGSGQVYREIDLRKTGDADKREDRPNMFYYFHFNEETSELKVSREETAAPGYRSIKPMREDGIEGRWRWGFDSAVKNIEALGAKFMPVRKEWGVFEKDYLKADERIKPTSAWTFKEVNTERGSEQLIELGFDKEDFPRPKPVGLLKRILQLGTRRLDSDIVLDFFGGSGTTAQAVLEQNAEDGGNRKFIVVQLPEIIKDSTFSNIADITKERVRRVAQRLNKAGEGKLPFGKKKECDCGFRVFKLDTSNFKPWNGTQPEDPEGLFNLLDSHAEHLLQGRSQEDILSELLLKSGFPLSTHVEGIQLAGKQVFSVEDGTMLVCLEEKLTSEVIKAIADKKPSRVICLDAGFQGNDQLKTNAVQTMKARGVLSFRTV